MLGITNEWPTNVWVRMATEYGPLLLVVFLLLAALGSAR